MSRSHAYCTACYNIAQPHPFSSNPYCRSRESTRDSGKVFWSWTELPSEGKKTPTNTQEVQPFHGQRHIFTPLLYREFHKGTFYITCYPLCVQKCSELIWNFSSSRTCPTHHMYMIVHKKQFLQNMPHSPHVHDCTQKTVPPEHAPLTTCT